MTEYNYDRSDLYPPDYRDELLERYYDVSRAENEYFEFTRENLRPRRTSNYESNSRSSQRSSRKFWGFGHGSQDQQIDQNDDDMSQLQSIGSNRPNPFNFYHVRSNRNHWF